MLAYMWHKWSTDQAIPWCPKPYCKVLIGLAEIPHINAWPGPMVVTLLYLRHHVVCCCKGTTRADQEILRQKSNMEKQNSFSHSRAKSQANSRSEIEGCFLKTSDETSSLDIYPLSERSFQRSVQAEVFLYPERWKFKMNSAEWPAG